MSKTCDMKGCGKPATWTYVTWDDEREGPKLTNRVCLCEEHADRYKDHEDVVERVRHSELEAMTEKVEKLEARIKRLEDKAGLTYTFNE